MAWQENQQGAAGRVTERFAKKTVSDTENFANLCLEHRRRGEIHSGDEGGACRSIA